MAKPELKTASVLAFERKLDPSDALFGAGRWNERDNGAHWPAVEVREKSVRGTISNRLKTKDQDPAKLDASIQSPNLQTVELPLSPTTPTPCASASPCACWVAPAFLPLAITRTTRPS